jgi:branched-chain amino acid transport system ATP-binding protein
MAISNLITGKKRGKISFCGQDLSKTESSAIVRQGISHIPEGRHIFPRLTVEENLLMGSFGSKRFSREKLMKNLEKSYAMFPRLKERRKQMGGTLSGGEQQMLAIGRGLMFNPALLMLDEPSLGLAPLIVKEIFEMILDIRDDGTTVLLIEQNAGMALQIADRGYVLENGQISLTDTGENLLQNEMVLKAYLGM